MFRWLRNLLGRDAVDKKKEEPQPDAVIPIDVDTIAGYLKNGASHGKIKEIMLTRWSLSQEKGYGPHDFYYDASEAFLLVLNGESLACIAFNVYKESSTVFINQVQSIRHKGRALSFLKWERFLIDFVTGWARESGFREALIQPAAKNRYWNGNDEDQNARLHIRYDVTARRLGFSYDPARECFAKTL